MISTISGINPTDVVFVIVAISVISWGFERYRTRFVKSDLVLALLLSSGITVFVFVPSVFDTLGSVFNITERFVVVTMISNIVFLSMLLYLVGSLRETRADVSEMTRNISLREVSQGEDGTETICVVIPAYNEEESIRSVVRSLPDAIRGYMVQPLVVSDGSADLTAERARESGATVVEHIINQGQGGALKTGFEVAQQKKADIVVTMDADGQHPVNELENLVAPIIDDKADFVMGSRYKGVDESGNGAVREAGIRIFTFLINLLTKAEITDCTNGYRAIRRSKLDDLTLKEERFSAPELIIEAKKNSMQIQEIPITIEEREAGETKKPQLMYGIGLFRTILVTWAR